MWWFWRHSYEIFRDWGLANGYRDDLTIERVDVNGNYSPYNCTWIPLPDQRQNTRLTHWITAFGETKSMLDWSKDPRCAVCFRTLCNRIDNYGWPPETAISAGLTAHWITAFGETKTMKNWSEDSRCSVNYYALRTRMAHGWEPEQAIGAPSGSRGHNRWA